MDPGLFDTRSIEASDSSNSMVIRVVLVVLVSVALLGVSLPALEDARSATSIDRLDAEAERLDREAAALASRSVAVTDPTMAARKTVTVRVPTGFTAARIDRVALGDPRRMPELDGEAPDHPNGDPSTGTPEGNVTRTPSVAFVYRIEGQRDRAVELSSSLSPPVHVVDGPIQLRTGGESTLRLRLVDVDGTSTVRIRRVG